MDGHMEKRIIMACEKMSTGGFTDGMHGSVKK